MLRRTSWKQMQLIRRTERPPMSGFPQRLAAMNHRTCKQQTMLKGCGKTQDSRKSPAAMGHSRLCESLLQGTLLASARDAQATLSTFTIFLLVFNGKILNLSDSHLMAGSTCHFSLEQQLCPAITSHT